MAFHCEKCGATLSGDYTSCPVCAKIEEMMRRIDAGETDVLKNWSAAVTDTATEELAEEPAAEAAPESSPAEEAAGTVQEEVYAGPIIETEVLSEETIPGDEPELPEGPEEEAEEEEWQPEAFIPEPVEIPADEEEFFPEEISFESGETELPEEEFREEEPTGFAEMTAEPAVIPVSYRTLAEIPIPSGVTAAQASEPEPVEPEKDGTPEYRFPEKKLGILEQQLADKAAKAGVKPKKKKGSLLFVLLILLLTLALAVVTAKFIIKPLLTRRAEEAAAKVYYDYIEGTWLSEYFAFSDRPNETVVELLTVNEDGSFNMKLMLPDMNHDNGWKDGAWETVSEISGQAKIIADTQTLLLEYESDGVSYYYERSFVSMNDGEMYLREYYD
ncbi:MAG: hypothetical protein IKD62_01260, partial [Oscillospiraceae bacterium]|nr:hypothetical protein [Oscillospiraceae bacterium]